MAGRILVVRGGAIGDFILTLPAIKLLRENFPSAEIEILGYRHIVAIAENRFYANRTRSIEYGALSSFFVPNGELPEELVEYFGSFNQVISYLYDPDRLFERNVRRCGVKNYIAGPGKLDDSEHAASQLARPLQSLALYLDERAAMLYPNEEDREFARKFFLGTQGKIIAFHPGSGSRRKNWPVARWLALGEKVWAADASRTILIVGGEADRGEIEAIAEGWKGRPILIGNDLPLTRLGGILERCAAFVGHDSGISHLAAAAGVASVILFGPTDPEIWGPANAKVKIVRAPEGEMEELDVETVAATLEEVLRGAG